MNFDDLYVGLSYTMVKAFTTNEVEHFALLSQDNNPVHLEDEYAKSSIFKDKIVHGFLTASLFSAIIGTKMPGNGSIYLSQTMNFKRPVFHNQLIQATVSVRSLNEEKRVVELDTICLDMKGNTLIEGSAVVKLI